jgi:WD40 repeat protein
MISSRKIITILFFLLSNILYSEQPELELMLHIGHTGTIYSVCFSPDGRYALSGSWDKTVKLWHVETGRCIRTFSGHEDYVESVFFSSNGKYALSWSSYSSRSVYKLWDVETGECLHTFKEQIWSTSACFHPDGNRILLVSKDLSLKIWDIEKGEYIQSFKGHSIEVSTVSISPDGNYILSSGARYKKAELKLWDAKTGECIQDFKVRDYRISSTCFSPDGRYILSGSINKFVRLWDIKTGKCLLTLKKKTNMTTIEAISVCFSPDGKYILSGKKNKFELWDRESGTLINTYNV